MEYGSLNNQIMAGSHSEVPKVGDGATILMWTDRRAATVIEVGPDYFVIQEDKVTRQDKLGMTDAQSYSYESDPNGSRSMVRMRKGAKGRNPGYHVCYEETGPTGRKRRSWGSRVGVGYRDHHYDYSF